MDNSITEDDVISILADVIKIEGGQSAYARKIGVSTQYVHRVLRRKARPSLTILMALGIGRVTSVKYVKMEIPRDG